MAMAVSNGGGGGRRRGTVGRARGHRLLRKSGAADGGEDETKQDGALHGPDPMRTVAARARWCDVLTSDAHAPMG